MRGYAITLDIEQLAVMRPGRARSTLTRGGREKGKAKFESDGNTPMARARVPS